MSNATAILELILISTVAFMNVLIGRYTYIPFVFPFLVATVLKGKQGKSVEIVALLFAGMYIIIFDNFYSGMVVLFAMTILFICYIHQDKRATYFILIISLIIGVASYVLPTKAKSIYVKSFLDAFYYGMISGAMLISIRHLIGSIKPKVPAIDEKYIELLEELQRIVHTYIDTLKKGAGDDRTRKDC
jgi:hypothetical protein